MPKSLRRLLPVLLVPFVVIPCSNAAQHKSGGASILLIAVLPPQLTMSVTPQPGMMNSFITSGHEMDFPVTINTHWVRGSGDVHVVVIAGDGFQSWRESRTLAVIDPQDPTQLTVNSTELAADKSSVITFRAQVL